MNPTTIPEPPAGAAAAGRALWAEVLGRYELEEHETALLVEIVRCMATLDELDAAVREQGVMVISPKGVAKANPAAVEARQQRITLARLQAALRLPAGEEPSGSLRRPQKRAGARGVYSIRPVS